MKRYIYKVAEWPFALHMPDGQTLDNLLPSFVPFRCGDGGQKLLFEVQIVEGTLPSSVVVRVVDEAKNDMGLVRILEREDGYRVEVRYTPDSPVQVLHTDRSFARVQAAVDWSDPYAGAALSALVRIVFSQAVIRQGGLSIHASAVMHEGRAYLFMGKSGTGKSTHAALWLNHLSGSLLINDDNPILRCGEVSTVVYGSPWSGKTPCYRNQGFVLGGVARLRQATANCFTPLKEVEAFIGMLPGCSILRTDSSLYNAACDTLAKISGEVPVGIMNCLPDEEAARMCASALKGNNNN